MGFPAELDLDSIQHSARCDASEQVCVPFWFPVGPLCPLGRNRCVREVDVEKWALFRFSDGRRSQLQTHLAAD